MEEAYTARIATLLVAAIAIATGCGGAADRISATRDLAATGRTADELVLPLRFEPNLGQLGDESTFLARSQRYTAELHRDGVILHHGEVPIELALVGGNPDASFRAGALSASSSRYLTSDGIQVVPNYDVVRMEDAYAGIDIVFRADGALLRFDLVAAPGTLSPEVRFQIPGAVELSVEEGVLVADVAGVTMRLSAPIAYQDRDGERHEVAASYVLAGRDTFGFELGEHDESLPVVIDPTIDISGDMNGVLSAVGTDLNANMVFGGRTHLSVTNTAGLIVKLDETGDVAWTMELPASQSGSMVTDLAVAPDGTIFAAVRGSTAETSDTSSSYLLSLSGNGDVLWRNVLFSRLVHMSVAVNGNEIYVASDDGELVKLFTNEVEEYRLQLFEEGTAVVHDIDVTMAGGVYVSGRAGAGLDTVGPLQLGYGGGESDAFVAFVDAGGVLRAMTYLGGAGDDEAFGVAADGGSVIVVGQTTSSDLPAQNAVQPEPQGGGDGFVAKLDIIEPNVGVEYLTYLGGSEDDAGSAVVVRSNGAVVVGGRTASEDFPVLAPLQSEKAASTDAFLTELSSDGELLFSTYWGGSGIDGVSDVALDDVGRLVVVGQALFGSVPDVNGPSPSPTGLSSDSFVLRLDMFDAAFTTPGGNNWWVEAYVDANEPLLGVDARVDGGEWRPLTQQSWGAWADSFFVPDGSVVEFRARSETGAQAVSDAYSWPSGEPASEEESVFEATFFGVRGNTWWVETDVRANARIAAVEASISDGPWQSLSPTDWGSWAASLHAPEGSIVQFRARSAGGQEALSERYRWPDAVPVDDEDQPDGFAATFSDVRGNNWWVEVNVSANEPLSAVNARVDGGGWRALDETDWGSWAASFFVPTGATVEFQAVSADGEAVVSTGYSWPP